MFGVTGWTSMPKILMDWLPLNWCVSTLIWLTVYCWGSITILQAFPDKSVSNASCHWDIVMECEMIFFGSTLPSDTNCSVFIQVSKILRPIQQFYFFERETGKNFILPWTVCSVRLLKTISFRKSSTWKGCLCNPMKTSSAPFCSNLKQEFTTWAFPLASTSLGTP